MPASGLKIWLDQEGAALVEMAVLTPFLLILGLGVFGFGNLLYQHQLITSGVRDAARYLARFDNPALFETAAKNLAVTGETSGTQQRVPWWDVSGVTVSYRNIGNARDADTGERPYRGGESIRIVNVTATATYPGLGFLGYLKIGPAIQVTLAHEERVIGE